MAIRANLQCNKKFRGFKSFQNRIFHKKFGPIGSAVLMFIGCIQTNKQRNKDSFSIAIVIMFSLCKLKKKKKKNFRNFINKISWILNFFISNCCRQIFENSIIHKTSLGSREVPQKTWPRSVKPF